MKARYIREIGTLGRFRIYWDTQTLTEHGMHWSNYQDGLSCPNGSGLRKPGYHNAFAPLGTSPKLHDWKAFGTLSDYEGDPRWPTVCSDCGAAVPEPVPMKDIGDVGIKVTRQIFASRLYDVGEEPQPGDVYVLRPHEGYPCPYWINCDGSHLYVKLPTGEHWDIDSRASNCDRQEDRTHRCWVKEGSAEAGTLTVSKNGHTCGAGAGSIATKGWHGFLRNFVFIRVA